MSSSILSSSTVPACFKYPGGASTGIRQGEVPLEELDKSEVASFEQPLDLSQSNAQIESRLQELKTSEQELFENLSTLNDEISRARNDCLKAEKEMAGFSKAVAPWEEGLGQVSALDFWKDKQKEASSSMAELQKDCARETSRYHLSHATVRVAEAMRNVFFEKKSQGQVVSSDGRALLEADERDFRAKLSEAGTKNEGSETWYARAKGGRFSGLGYDVVQLCDYPQISQDETTREDHFYMPSTRREDGWESESRHVRLSRIGSK